MKVKPVLSLSLAFVMLLVTAIGCKDDKAPAGPTSAVEPFHIREEI